MRFLFVAAMIVATAGCALDPQEGFSTAPAAGPPLASSVMQIQSATHWDIVAERIVASLKGHLRPDQRTPVEVVL